MTQKLNNQHSIDDQDGVIVRDIQDNIERLNALFAERNYTTGQVYAFMQTLTNFFVVRVLLENRKPEFTLEEVIDKATETFKAGILCEINTLNNQGDLKCPNNYLN